MEKTIKLLDIEEFQGILKKVKLLDRKGFEKIVEVREIRPIIHYCTFDGLIDFELFGEEDGIVIYKEIIK